MEIESPLKVVSITGKPAVGSFISPLISISVELPAEPTAVNEIVAAVPPVVPSAKNPTILAEVEDVIFAVTPDILVEMLSKLITEPIEHSTSSSKAPILEEETLTEIVPVEPSSAVDGAFTLAVPVIAST